MAKTRKPITYVDAARYESILSKLDDTISHIIHRIEDLEAKGSRKQQPSIIYANLYRRADHASDVRASDYYIGECFDSEARAIHVGKSSRSELYPYYKTIQVLIKEGL